MALLRHSKPQNMEGVSAMTLKLISPAFKDGAPIPAKYTCEGEDVSPPLSWTGAPAGTKSLALIVDDPDAPDPKAPRMTWVHWVLYDLPVQTSEIAEGANRLPPGTRLGLNDWKRAGYGGPCPPIGRHRYFHKLYSLDTELGDLKQPTKPKLLEAMEGHVLAEAVLMGTYEKRKR
jgi:Raf kinase inhibitor-like YbhB/YbcL family protein